VYVAVGDGSGVGVGGDNASQARAGSRKISITPMKASFFIEFLLLAAEKPAYCMPTLSIRANACCI
jgi:hypothetical protein